MSHFNIVLDCFLCFVSGKNFEALFSEFSSSLRVRIFYLGNLSPNQQLKVAKMLTIRHGCAEIIYINFVAFRFNLLREQLESRGIKFWVRFLHVIGLTVGARFYLETFIEGGLVLTEYVCNNNYKTKTILEFLFLQFHWSQCYSTSGC